MLVAMIVGHGIDLCDIERIRRLLADHGDHFLDRTYTPAEVAYARGRQRGFEASLAARFAAKEAVMKALGTGWTEGVAFGHIEVRVDALGKPFLVLSEGAAAKARERGITAWHLTLSHTETLAIASVIAEGPGPATQGPAGPAE